MFGMDQSLFGNHSVWSDIEKAAVLILCSLCGTVRGRGTIRGEKVIHVETRLFSLSQSFMLICRDQGETHVESRLFSLGGGAGVGLRLTCIRTGIKCRVL